MFRVDRGQELRLNPLAAAYPFGELGARLKAARLFRNVSRETAAQACRVDEWHYGDLERGKYPVTRAQLVALEALLGFDRHWVETGISPVARLIELDDSTLVSMFGSAVNPDLPAGEVAEGIRRALRARLPVGDVGEIPDMTPDPEPVRLADRFEAAGRWVAKGGLFGFLVTFAVLMFSVLGSAFTSEGLFRVFIGYAAIFLAVWSFIAGIGVVVAGVCRQTSGSTSPSELQPLAASRPLRPENQKGLAI